MKSQPLEKLIVGSKKLISIFGGWPSFHDAEVTEIHLHRGEISEENGIFDLPVLTVKLVLWNLTSRVNAAGHLETEGHTLTVLQFSDVDALTMSGFNYQNAIMGLRIKPESTDERDERVEFHVSFDPAFGMGCEFKCRSIEVLNALPWDISKRPPQWLSREEMAKVPNAE